MGWPFNVMKSIHEKLKELALILLVIRCQMSKLAIIF
jgi:hypothetical protein